MTGANCYNSKKKKNVICHSLNKLMMAHLLSNVFVLLVHIVIICIRETKNVYCQSDPVDVFLVSCFF